MRPLRGAQHVLGRPLGHPVQRREVGVDDAREVVLAHPQEQAVAGDAGIGHEDLDRIAEVLGDLGECAVDVVADVTSHFTPNKPSGGGDVR